MRHRREVTLLCLCALGAFMAITAAAQTSTYERTYPQSKAAVDKALKTMQGLAGRLPVLDGFAQPGDHPFEHYQRGYYQAAFEVNSAPGGASRVRVSTKVTAWYSDPTGARSGYQLLKSNGRLENDLLDQLGDQLASIPAQPKDHPAPSSAPVASGASSKAIAEQRTISAPSLQFPDTNQSFSSLSHGLASSQPPTAPTPEKVAAENSNAALAAEAESLEKILKGMGHPNNLVAVKKSGTAVVSAPSLTAKPQFLANMHDEFELLDFNADWVHVRISGLSRGWIWRNSVEMPEGIPNTAPRPAAPVRSADDLFHVSREEIAMFPGDWEPLRNKNVKIISVQKTDEGAKDAGLDERLEYTKFLLEKSFAEISAKPQELQGVVVIFDSADGGMIAATAAVLQQWSAGTLTDAALWHQCFFDPPETLDSAAASGSK